MIRGLEHRYAIARCEYQYTSVALTLDRIMPPINIDLLTVIVKLK